MTGFQAPHVGEVERQTKTEGRRAAREENGESTRSGKSTDRRVLRKKI